MITGIFTCQKILTFHQSGTSIPLASRPHFLNLLTHSSLPTSHFFNPLISHSPIKKSQNLFDNEFGKNTQNHWKIYIFNPLKNSKISQKSLKTAQNPWKYSISRTISFLQFFKHILIVKIQKYSLNFLPLKPKNTSKIKHFSKNQNIKILIFLEPHPITQSKTTLFKKNPHQILFTGSNQPNNMLSNPNHL